MTIKTAQSFIMASGTVNTLEAMRVGHDARTEGLRIIANACAQRLKSLVHTATAIVKAQ